MHLKTKISKSNGILLFLSLIHWLITFYTDQFVFDESPSLHKMNYIICKIILLFLLFFLYRSIYRIVFFKNRKDTIEYHVAKYALIYLIPIIAVLIIKLPQGFLSNDETLIFKEASGLASYTWFYYLTTYYYIITMMLIPSWLGPILVKVILQLSICGYCIYRLSRYKNFKYGKLLYLAFLLPPVLAYTTSAHRIPIYYLLYLLLIFLLLMDTIEQIAPTRTKITGILILSAVLTQWRTEGIYLIVLVPILLLIVYKDLRTKQQIIKIIIGSLLIQYLFTIPQNGALLPARLDDQAENRMGPFYAYTITNMYRNGLDLEKNSSDWKEINRYLNTDTIVGINDYLGDTNYEDVLILYYEGYTGTRPEADSNDYMAYVNACKRIFINNPYVLLKTRIGAFCYASTPYHFVWPTGGIKGLISFAISIIKVFAYNLYIPHILLICLWIYSIIKRKWYTFFVTSGLCCHWFIVFILAPASYFKYYFPIYMTMYFYFILVLIGIIYSHYHKDDKLTFIQ